MSDNSTYTTEFKHDTNNLAIFVIIVFCTCSVLFIISVCLVLFRYGKDSEYHEKVVSQKNIDLENLRKREADLLSKTGAVRTDDGIVYFMPLEEAMEKTIRNYNK